MVCQQQNRAMCTPCCSISGALQLFFLDNPSSGVRVSWNATTWRLPSRRCVDAHGWSLRRMRHSLAERMLNYLRASLVGDYTPATRIHRPAHSHPRRALPLNFHCQQCRLEALACASEAKEHVTVCSCGWCSTKLSADRCGRRNGERIDRSWRQSALGPILQSLVLPTRQSLRNTRRLAR